MRAPCLAAVIPAAGYSSRMGRFKPLMPLGGSTVIERVISLFNENGITEIIVVIGHGKDQLKPLLEHLPVRIVENEFFAQGMFSSIAAGVDRIGSACDAFFILPADIPLVRPQTLQLLARAYANVPGHIIHPVFQGKRGHPPLIAAGFARQIVQWRADGGLKSFFAAHGHLSVDLPLPDRHILFDIDTPEDYNELTRRWDHYEVLSQSECEMILSAVHPVSERTLAHSRKVAQVAEEIGQSLVGAGLDLELDLIRAGALLHDVAKGRKDHAEVGAELITGLGFASLGRIVGAHTDLIPDPRGRIGETEVVYMADKLVKADRLIPLAQRFQEPLDRWAADPEAVQIILRRRNTASRIKLRMEELLEKPLEEILGRLI